MSSISDHDSTSDVSVELTEAEQLVLQSKQHEEMMEIFLKYDEEKKDQLKTADFPLALEDLGESVNQKELWKMVAELDPQNKGTVDFVSFKNVILNKRLSEKGSSKQELLDAYIAMGGEEDGEGCIDADKLINVIKEEFEMTIDIEKLI